MRSRVTMPKFSQLRLGDYMRDSYDPNCRTGCLVFHLDRLAWDLQLTQGTMRAAARKQCQLGTPLRLGAIRFKLLTHACKINWKYSRRYAYRLLEDTLRSLDVLDDGKEVAHA